MSINLLTLAEAAPIARVHIDTLRNWIANGSLRAYQPSGKGGRLYVDRTELEAALRRPAAAPQPRSLDDADYWRTPAPGASPFDDYIESADNGVFLVDVHGSHMSEYLAARRAQQQTR